jgi:Signal transduction histidine kinase
MKHSIKRQISLTFIGLIVLLVIAIEICNFLFLEKFYLNHKSEILFEGMNYLNQSSDFTDEANQATQDLMSFCMTENLAIVTTSSESDIVHYLNMRQSDAKLLSSRLFGYLTGVDDATPEILRATTDYRIQINRDYLRGRDYIEIWGELTGGQNFIIQTPLESIKESVAISNRFFLYIGAGVILIGVIFIGHFSHKITRPITELTNISQQMANLDFDAKYESGGDNEIGILGENLNRLSDILLKSLTELKTANNELKKDIEKKNEIDAMRREFLSNVSHELKTPIALIRGYAEGLQENVTDGKEKDFYCEVIVDESNKMNEMVKKLLSLNQIESGQAQVEMERFDLIALIRGILQSTAILIQQKQAEVIFRQKTPLYVWGDEYRIETVMTNFVSNALNHLSGDNRIEIRCEEKAGLVYTSIFNSGEPIPSEEIDKIWLKFYKVDKARTREYGGSGIGLSIVKAIMNSMNQQYGVRNYENGVEFWFALESKMTK